MFVPPLLTRPCEYAVQTLSGLFSPSALVDAWDHVLERDAQDGRIAASVRRFGEDAKAGLAALHTELLNRRYEPAPLNPVQIEKADGSVRELHIPVARDRVVERALATGIAPRIDTELCPSAFAYRSGLGVADAVRSITSARADGLLWGVRVDIENCFPTINRQRMMRKVEALGLDLEIVNLIKALVTRQVRDRNRLVARRRGLPQGGSLSPYLSNLYLTPVDLGMWRRGHFLVRYSDDMLLLADSASGVSAALADLERLVAQGDQRLGASKTMKVTFEEGFTYLGEEFNLRYPESVPNDRRTEPLRRTLVVGHQGAGVRISKGRLVISRGDSELLSVPSSQVGRVVLSGSVGLSAGARSWALANNVGVVLLSRRGRFLGSVVSGAPAEAALRRAQYRFTESDQKCLRVSSRILFGKLSNQRTLLLRHSREGDSESVRAATQELDFGRGKLDQCDSRSELMGMEGIGARRYWQAVGELLPTEVLFNGRQRRPPPDLTNCALGYGYAILLGEAVSALAIAGADPACGVLHGDDDRRPSLALDLIEEFRPVIIDAVVVRLVRKRSLTVDHVRPDPDRVGGVLLTEKGRKVLMAAVEDRLLTVFRHIPSGQRVTYRRALLLQARQIVQAIRSDGDATYRPVLWR